MTISILWILSLIAVAIVFFLWGKNEGASMITDLKNHISTTVAQTEQSINSKVASLSTQVTNTIGKV